MDDARVGAQLRAARLAARKSMAEVAEEAGLTKGFLSKLERDLANVSVASLIRLCDALGVSVGSLFQPSKGEVVRAGERPPINFGGKGMSEYLLTPAHERRMQAILSALAIGAAVWAMAPRRKKPQVAGSRNRITRSATCSALAESRHGQLEMQGRCGRVPHRLDRERARTPDRASGCLIELTPRSLWSSRDRRS